MSRIPCPSKPLMELHRLAQSADPAELEGLYQTLADQYHHFTGASGECDDVLVAIVAYLAEVVEQNEHRARVPLVDLDAVPLRLFEGV